VVVDKFSKAIVITPCRKDITAEEMATLFLNNIWKRFGLPDRIISDRGPQFASQVTKEIWKTLGIERSMSMAYHPQTDGEMERVNQEIEQYLRSMIMHSPRDGSSYFHSWNSCTIITNTALCENLFKVLHGFINLISLDAYLH